MKNIVFSIATILLLASCSDSEIPTSSGSKTVDWSALKKNYNIESHPQLDSETDEVEDASIEDISERGNLVSDKKSESEDSFDEEYEDSDNFSEKDNIYENSDDISESETTESDIEIASEESEIQDSADKFDEYEKELEKEMAKALVNYPRPPSPANLSPYDSRERDSYREATTSETSGSGDFPPAPPTMMFDTN